MGFAKLYFEWLRMHCFPLSVCIHWRLFVHLQYSSIIHQQCNSSDVTLYLHHIPCIYGWISSNLRILQKNTFSYALCSVFGIACFLNCLSLHVYAYRNIQKLSSILKLIECNRIPLGANAEQENRKYIVTQVKGIWTAYTSRLFDSYGLVCMDKLFTETYIVTRISF